VTDKGLEHALDQVKMILTVLREKRRAEEEKDHA
jgi:hypothetical protein